MVTDQEPRYRLVDADGNVVGSLFAESDGTLKLQEGTSGNDNQLSLDTGGRVGVEQLSIADSTTVISLTTNASIPSGSDTLVPMDTVETENANVLSADLSNDRINVQSNGLYLVSGTITWQTDAGWTVGDRAGIEMERAGTSPVKIFGRNGTRKQSTRRETRPLPARVINAADGDNFRLLAFQDSGSSKALSGVQRDHFLSVTKVA